MKANGRVRFAGFWGRKAASRTSEYAAGGELKLDVIARASAGFRT